MPACFWRNRNDSWISCEIWARSWLRIPAVQTRHTSRGQLSRLWGRVLSQ